MQPASPENLLPDAAGVDRAAQILASGGLVALPTETVYGLGADARNPAAVAAIFAAKGRPATNPLIVHVADRAAAEAIGLFDGQTRALADAFWPGPLTLVVPLRTDAGLPPAVTAGAATVALRVPAHPVAQALLRRFGGPVAAPSANPSGRISPTRAQHVRDGLGRRVTAILDGGACPVGVESSIVTTIGGPRLLRPGGLSVEDIEAVLGAPVALSAGNGGPASPGQLASHYAPAAALRLNATALRDGEVWVGFGPGGPPDALSLSETGDPAEAAARLFEVLRAADHAAGPGGRIAVAPVPMSGLGRAVNDRLSRAAAPRT
jgi:L-threonylcarbamoyladenylate synthase